MLRTLSETTLEPYSCRTPLRWFQTIRADGAPDFSAAAILSAAADLCVQEPKFPRRLSAAPVLALSDLAFRFPAPEEAVRAALSRLQEQGLVSLLKVPAKECTLGPAFHVLPAKELPADLRGGQEYILTPQVWYRRLLTKEGGTDFAAAALLALLLRDCLPDGTIPGRTEPEAIAEKLGESTAAAAAALEALEKRSLLRVPAPSRACLQEDRVLSLCFSDAWQAYPPLTAFSGTACGMRSASSLRSA